MFQAFLHHCPWSSSDPKIEDSPCALTNRSGLMSVNCNAARPFGRPLCDAGHPRGARRSRGRCYARYGTSRTRKARVGSTRIETLSSSWSRGPVARATVRVNTSVLYDNGARGLHILEIESPPTLGV